jgi:D-amino-acid dehydrogenase
MIVPSHFVPLAQPGIVSQGIKWMFNSKSPFYIRPSLNMDLVSWGMKFLKSATRKNTENSAIPLRDINLYSKALYQELEQQPGFDFALENKGILMYYKTAKVAEEEIHLAKKARELGLDTEVLTREQIQKMEPATALDIQGAVHYRCDSHLYPFKLMSQLISHLIASGVKIEKNNAVQKMITDKNAIKKVITQKGEYKADIIVLAAGSWLRELSKMAGIHIPLMPGKGYSFTCDNPIKKLNFPAILCEARVAITPMNGMMRYGGTMEIAPVNNKININRVKGIVESVVKYFPDIDIHLPEEKDIWYGFRPCSPDGLPYIGKSQKIHNAFIAGGHAMSGLSLGPATGKIIADLANGKNPEINIDVFSAERFS